MGQLLALDFDGVINGYQSGWIKEDPTHLPDPAVPGAFQFIKEAQDHFDVVVHSSRLKYDGAERYMRFWMLREAQAQGFTFEEARAIVDKLSFSLIKPPAHVTLDDRAIQFNGVFPPLEDIFAFKPWNKRSTLIERGDRDAE